MIFYFHGNHINFASNSEIGGQGEIHKIRRKSISRFGGAKTQQTTCMHFWLAYQFKSAIKLPINWTIKRNEINTKKTNLKFTKKKKRREEKKRSGTKGGCLIHGCIESDRTTNLRQFNKIEFTHLATGLFFMFLNFDLNALPHCKCQIAQIKTLSLSNISFHFIFHAMITDLKKIPIWFLNRQNCLGAAQLMHSLEGIFNLFE